MPWGLIAVLIVMVAGAALVVVFGRLLVMADRALDRAHEKMLSGAPPRWHRVVHHPRKWWRNRCHHCFVVCMEHQRTLREERQAAAVR